MDDSRVRVRPATRADVAACAALAEADGAGDGHEWTRTFRRTVDDGGDRVLFVAVDGDAVVGYARAVHLSTSPDVGAKLPSGWYLLGVVVAPAFRRRGIGRMLTAARLEWLRGRAGCVHYFTDPRNTASQALHAELGFEPLPIVASIKPADGTRSAERQFVFRLELPGPG